MGVQKTNSVLSARRGALSLLLLMVLVVASYGPAAAGQVGAAPAAPAGQGVMALLPVADASLDASQPGENICCGETLSVFHHGPGQSGRALLGFDLPTAIPSGAVIDAAGLDLYQVAGASRGSVTLSAHVVSAAWDEATVTWSSQPANHGPVAPAAFDDEEGWKHLDVTGIVQESFAQGQPLSLRLAGPEGAAAYSRSFQSRESRDYAPRLEVSYQVPGHAGWTFGGHVYHGEPSRGAASHEGAIVELYGAHGAWQAGDSGNLLARTETGRGGTFSLSWDGGSFPYFHVVETDPPGTHSTWAQASPPGAVANLSVVSYSELMEGSYGGINFWDDALPAGCQELVANGGFEAGGLAPWGSEGQAGLGLGYTGEAGARLGGSNGVQGEIFQEVDIPQGAGPVALQFWWLASSASEQPGDVLRVSLQGRGDNVLRSLTATGPLGEWRPVSVDVTDYAGERLWLSFHATTDSAGPTTFRVDEVRLSACGTAPPDLTASDLRLERGQVCYTVANQGDGPSPGDHTTALFVDGDQLARHEVSRDLGPGARQAGCFDYDWSCGGTQDEIRVQVDDGQRVAEVDEGNNTWRVVWHCGESRYAVSWPGHPPAIDGQASYEEWGDAVTVPLAQGALRVYNDAANLYLLLDLTADSQEDAGDSFMASFDTDTDRSITPRVDLNYAGETDQALDLEVYAGPGQWEARAGDTFSQMAAGFGPSPEARTPHRLWELAISLAEIQAAPGGRVRLGLKTVSQTPVLVGENPPGFTADFSGLIDLRLARAKVELLVLADEAFLDALKPLKEHKVDTGIPTYVQSWQSLDRAFGPLGKDAPERIKRAIAAYETQAHTKWVMLTGDSDRFPVRYLSRDYPQPRGFQPGDLYYADLYRVDGTFDDWDGNKNGLYGQIDASQATNNVDQIDWHPDVAVGRVPASTVAEVTTYVQKVVDYEFAAYGTSWFKTALLATGCSDCGDGVGLKNEIAKKYLGGYSVIKHYHDTVWPAYPIDKSDIKGSVDKRAAPMTQYLNDGVGFLNYYGHGSIDDFCWVYDSRHLNDLTNTQRLPVIFSRACGNGEYAPSPPFQGFRDASGKVHTAHAPQPGEVVPVPDPIQPGAGSATDCDREARPEDWLVKRGTGGIAMIASAGPANAGYDDVLDTDFFRAYHEGIRVFGDMWRYIVQRYLDNYGSFDAQGNNTGYNDWHRKVIWNGLIRYHAFGDPSLRVGGLAHILKKDLYGSWAAISDGLAGELQLRDAAGDHPELKPDLSGTHTGPGGQQHDVIGWMRTWRDPKPPSWGPDHKVVFQIDTSGAPGPEDDPRYEGYLFTQTKEGMAGIIWQDEIPHGFYALKGPGALKGRPQASEPMPADVVKADFLGTYRAVLDGEPGALILEALPDDPGSGAPNIVGVFIPASGQAHGVRGYVRTPDYPLPRSWGPDHQILLAIDFPGTPDPDDDQRLEGYLLVHGKQGLAGITWQEDLPYGFYALKTRGIFLPLLAR